MKRNLICLLLIAAMAAGLLFNASAADTADLKISGVAHSGGNITVSVEFVNIPENNPVEYAQILLTCRTSQHNIASGSMRFNGDANDMLATETFNTSADSLLVLLEPTGSSSVGMGDGLVYTFHIREGVYWYTSDGQPYAELTAQDFVAGFHHMLDTERLQEQLVHWQKNQIQ